MAVSDKEVYTYRGDVLSESTHGIISLVSNSVYGLV